MAIELIVEDGSIVPNANTYASIATLRAYAEMRPNIDLPDDDDELAKMCIVAMDYLESLEWRFKGQRVNPELQVLSWPRSGVVINCYPQPNTTIPKNLVNALCQLTVEATTLNGDLNPSQTEYAIKQEVIGPMSTTYAVDTVNGSTVFTPTFPKVTAFLRPLFTSMGGSTYR